MKTNYVNTDQLSPGQFLRQEIKARGISQKTFARMLNILPSHLSEVINGSRAISKQMAVRLEETLKIEAIFWLNLQLKYDEILEQSANTHEADAETIKLYEELNKICNVKYIVKKLGVVADTISKMIDIFREKLLVEATYAVQKQYNAFHKSSKTGLDGRMINTWAVLANYYANNEGPVYGNYKDSCIPQLVSTLSDVFHKNKKGVEKKVKDVLSENGIRFLIVPKVEKASIDGYTFYCNDGTPAIVVTKRIPTIDNFAFAIMHEVGHLALHHVDKMPTISISTENESAIEQEANEFASNALIPKQLWAKAPATRLDPYEIKKTYSIWAKQHNLNQWIVLGRISHELGVYRFKVNTSRDIN